MGHLVRWVCASSMLLLVACGAPAPAGGEGAGRGPAPSPSASGAVAPAAAVDAPRAGTAAESGRAESAPPLQRIEVPLASISATSTPLWVAANKGLFARHGLDVTLIGMPPATASQALSAGSVAIATTGGSTISAWLGGAKDLVFVGGVTNKAVFKLLARPEIGRMEDLRGQAVGTVTPGSGGALALFELLRRFGLEPE